MYEKIHMSSSDLLIFFFSPLKSETSSKTFFKYITNKSFYLHKVFEFYFLCCVDGRKRERERKNETRNLI